MAFSDHISLTKSGPAPIQPAAPQIPNATLNSPNNAANGQGSRGAYPASLSSGVTPPGAEPTTPVNPLDEFSSAFESMVAGSGASAGAKTAPPEALFPVDSAQLSQTINGLDFTSTVPKELFENALKGDASALAESLNHVGRAAFGYNLNTTMKLVEQGIEKKLAQFEKRVPGMIDTATSKSVVADDPRLNHPALAPMKGAIEQMLTAQFPQASATQRKQYMDKYLLGVVQQLGGGAPVPSKAPTNQDALPTNSNGADFWEQFEKSME